MDAWHVHDVFVCFSKVKFKDHTSALGQKEEWEKILRQQWPGCSHALIPAVISSEPISMGEWH